MFSMVLLCPLSFSLLPLFFDGKLSGSKYSRVCALYAEKEQQCLATGVACRYPANAIVLFLIAEAALHGGRAQCPYDPSCCADTCVFILWLGTFADKTGRDTVFGTVSPILIVGIDGVCTDSGDFRTSQFLLIINAFL